MVEYLREMIAYLQAMIGVMEDCTQSWGINGIVDTPKGRRQDDDYEGMPFNHTYINQHSGAGEDDYYGTQYFPLPDGRYIETWWTY